jgi:predicted DNA-binding transcriptional regulator YafY
MSGVKRNAAKESTPDYAIPGDFRLRDHAASRQAWELGDGDATEVEVEWLRQTGAVAAAARLGAAVDGHPARRRFAVRRMDAFARWLLSFGGDARPVSPPALVEELRDQATRTRALYASDAQEAEA